MASVPLNGSDHELTTTRFLASLVDYAGRALDADSGGLARQARANRQQCRAKLLTDQRFRYFGTNPSRILSECETSDCLG